MESLVPFIKWAGGKRQVIKILQEHCPKEFDTYYEPFLGGGALFLHLQPRKAKIGDTNAKIIQAFKSIETMVSELINCLEQHKSAYTGEDYYYNLRAKEISLQGVEASAAFIFLNKTCYNGLYRENNKGQFNVPFGKYTNPKIYEKENLLKINQYLIDNNIIIKCCNYQELCKDAKAGDFIYFDPPYYPAKKTSFTKYNKDNFLEKEHEELKKEFIRLHNLGCKVMLSNSNVDFIKNLYKEFKQIEIEAKRSINSNIKHRAKAKLELLVFNY